MRLDEYTSYDAIGLSELLRAHEVTATEVAECAAAAARTLNPKLNALVGEIDPSVRGVPGREFSGVPILGKSGHGRAGGPLGAGSRLLAGEVATQDDYFSARIRNTGVAFLGATTAPEFGLYAVTESSLHGPSRNPWDTTRSPGGSSGGASAAVAAGIVPIATSGDGGGSIRTPAHCTGLFGMKPSRGRTPFEGNHFFHLSINHVSTRTVRDSAAFLDASEGHYPGARYLVPAPTRAFREEVGAATGRLRIGYTTQLHEFASADAECADAVTRTAALLAELGHEVIEASPSMQWQQFFDAFMGAWTHSLPWSIARIEQSLGVTADAQTLETMTERYRELGESVTVAQLLDVDQVFRAASRAVDEYFASFDVWLTPTAVSQAPMIGRFDPAASSESAVDYSFRVLREYSAFTPLLNVTGHPAASVPVMHGKNGLPVGVQLVCRAAGDAELIRLSAQLEAAQPWLQRRPPLWAGSLNAGGSDA